MVDWGCFGADRVGGEDVLLQYFDSLFGAVKTVRKGEANPEMLDVEPSGALIDG